MTTFDLDSGVVSAVAQRRRLCSFTRRGGMVFWRVGRLGGSFYLASADPAAAKAEKAVARERRAFHLSRLRYEARMWRRYGYSAFYGER